jgi:hypothetical protein
MAETKNPNNFCNILPGMNPGAPGELPTAQTDVLIQVRLPMGLPTVSAPSATCEGLSILAGNLTATTAPMLPVINLAGGVLSVIDAIKAIPDAIGGNPIPLAEALDKLAGTVALLVEMTGQNPITYVKFIYDLCGVIIKTLTCLQAQMTISIQNGQEVELLNAKADVQLQDVGSCLKVQNDALTATMKASFQSQQAIITLLNVIITALPPVQAITGTISTGSNDLSPEAIDGLIIILEDVRALCAAIPGVVP